MKYITTYLSVALVAFFVSNAQSQFIEIRYEVTVADYAFKTRTGQSVLVFDTSVAPEIGANGIEVYHAISGWFYVDAFSRFPTPFKVLDTEIEVFDRAELIYIPSTQEVSVTTFSTSGRRMKLLVHNMGDGFFKGMGSLPDMPELYAMVDDYELQFLTGRIHGSQAYWNSKDGFSNGAVTYSARLVTELEPEACSPADLNQDGIVDFFDINIFIQLFMQGCP